MKRAPDGVRRGVRAILTYHSIDPSGSVISVDEPTFDRHVRFLGSGRVRVLPLADLWRDDAPGDAVALTFDDGFSNFATAAWPRLRDHGLPATVFVVCDRVGADNRWHGREDPRVPTLPLLAWDDVARVAGEGVAIGSHTRSHPRLGRTAGAALADEIGGSADDIEHRTGRRPTSFCYPFGEFDDRAVAAVVRTYQQACTTQLRTLPPDPDPHRLPRLDGYYFRRPGELEAWGSPHFRARIRGRAGLRAVRHAISHGRSATSP